MVPVVGSTSTSMRSHCDFGGAAQFAQAVLGIEGVDGGVAAGAFDDAADHGVHVVGVLLDEVADGGVALGDPGAGVEQFGGGAEEGEIDLDFASADGFQARDGFGVERGGGVVAEEFELVGGRNAEAERARRATARHPRRGAARARRDRRGRSRARRVQTVCASSQLSAKMETQSSVRQAGTTPRVLSDAARGLQADQVVERRGHASGSGGVGAEREADQAGGDGDGGAGTGAAGDVARVEDAGAGAVRRARARPGRWRTDPCWSCRWGWRRRRSAPGRRWRCARACRRRRDSRRWSAGRRDRCCL